MAEIVQNDKVHVKIRIRPLAEKILRFLQNRSWQPFRWGWAVFLLFILFV